MTPTILLSLAATVAAPIGKDAKKDPPSIVGEWAAEGAVSRGRPDNPPPGTTWEFTADGKSILKIGGKGETVDGTYKLDPKKDPPEIDITPGIKNMGTMQGVYKVEGDTLTLCLSDGEEERPKALDAPAGTKRILITLKRMKKKD